MPVVCVHMPAYRHAAFIAQAIDSVLAQKTDFDVHILIGEDGSDDSTPDICREYERLYPDRIRVIYRDRSKKTDYADSLPGRQNVIDLYKQATGEFVALLEGDDYWIDTNKLQAQVDHLRAHPEQSFCFTNAYNLYPSGKREDYVRGWLGGKLPEAEMQQRDIVAKNFIPTAGVMYRRDRLTRYPPIFQTVAALDQVLYITLAEQGGFGFLDRMSAVRRIHEGGVVSMKGLLVKIDRSLHQLQEIDVMTEGRYAELLLDRRAELNRMAIQHAVDSGEPEKGAKYLKELVKHPGLRERTSTRELLRSGILVHTPALARIVHRYRSTH